MDMFTMHKKWFNKEPEDMYASIDDLLGLVGTGTYDPEGAFDAVFGTGRSFLWCGG
jgi:hypothetical protein